MFGVASGKKDEGWMFMKPGLSPLTPLTVLLLTVLRQYFFLQFLFVCSFCFPLCSVIDEELLCVVVSYISRNMSM